MKNKMTVILISFFLLLTTAFMFYYFRTMKAQNNPLPVLGNPGHKVGPFSFVNQDGQTITNKDVEGKITVVNYFFTTCKGICPKMSTNMTRVFSAYRNDDNVLILSHTVDPEFDTLGALKAYGTKYNADGRHWQFLTGSKSDLYKAARKSYLIAVSDTGAVDTEQDFIHSENFVLVDREGRIRGKVYDGTKLADVDELIRDIHELERE